jgi:ABC-type glycerol-3-phosphate transport system permease component
VMKDYFKGAWKVTEARISQNTLKLHKKSNAARLSQSDKIFHILNYIILTLVGLIVFYPLVYTVSSSFSSTQAILEHRVILLPVNFTVESYKAVLNYSLLRSGFMNSILYTALNTIVAVTLLLLAAYPLSRKDIPGRKYFLIFFVITMFFNGGMIPNYLLMNNLRLTGTRWALIIAFTFSCYNMIIVKSYFQINISPSLLDAAHIDGCNDLDFFRIIVLPISKPIIATMVLFNAVGNWNGYFNAMLYLNKPEMYPMQIILRDILFIASMPPEIMNNMDQDKVQSLQNLYEQLRYAVLVVGALPMMILYPFVQKYFIKGVMIGSLKE